MPVSAGLANEKVAPVDFRPLFGRGRYARRMKRMTPLFAPLIMIGLALGWFAGEFGLGELGLPGVGRVAAGEADLSGTVTHVRDGDTIVVGDTPVRLQGVSAPERGDPHGPASARFMRELTLGRTVVCDLTGERTYDRVVGLCRLDGRDVGEAIVRAGLALDCPRFSGGRYRAAEQAGDARSRLSGYRLPGYC